MNELRTGALRHRLTLEAVSRVDDEGGGGIVLWTPVSEVWAGIEPLPGREVVLADGVKAVVTHEVRLRHREGVDSTMRFVRPTGGLLEIRAVRDVEERRRWLVCQCEERLP